MVNWELERWNSFTTTELTILERWVWLESKPEIMGLTTFTRFCHNHDHFFPLCFQKTRCRNWLLAFYPYGTNIQAMKSIPASENWRGILTENELYMLERWAGDTENCTKAESHLSLQIVLVRGPVLDLACLILCRHDLGSVWLNSRSKLVEVEYGPGFYFVMFVTFKEGKACKSLRLQVFQRTRNYPVTKCKLTVKTESPKQFVSVNSLSLSLSLVKSIGNFKYYIDKIGLYVFQIMIHKKKHNVSFHKDKNIYD